MHAYVNHSLITITLAIPHNNKSQLLPINLQAIIAYDT